MSDTGLTKVNYLSYWIHILPNATSPGHSGKKRIVCCISICWGAPPKKKSIQILKKKEVKREWSAALVFVERSLPSEFQQCARLTLTSQHLILLILMSLIEMYLCICHVKIKTNTKKSQHLIVSIFMTLIKMYLVYLSCHDKERYRDVTTQILLILMSCIEIYILYRSYQDKDDESQHRILLILMILIMTVMCICYNKSKRNTKTSQHLILLILAYL